MGFLKEFVMKHPFISMLILWGIGNRAEDAYYMHKAQKNGTTYKGHRFNHIMPEMPCSPADICSDERKNRPAQDTPDEEKSVDVDEDELVLPKMNIEVKDE